MYKTTSILALGLFLTLAPQAYAQTESEDQLQIQQDTQQQEMTTQDQAADPDAMDTEQQATDQPEGLDTDQQATDQPEGLDTDQQATDQPEGLDTEQQAVDEPADMDTEQQAATDEPAAGEEEITGQIAEQEEGTFLSSSLMGSEVMSEDGESIGTISDLIITEDGDLQGVVVGVGGFLGIGEKRVAIGMGSIEVRPSMDDPNQIEIISDQSRAELEEGTAFKTTADIRAEEEAAQAEQEAQQAQPTEPTVPAE